MEMSNFEKTDPRVERMKLFKKDAEQILGDQYNGMEIDDIVSYFNDDAVEKWSKELSSLAERIDVNKDKLSPEEIIVMKAKFIGEMAMYAELSEDRRDAKRWREREQ